MSWVFRVVWLALPLAAGPAAEAALAPWPPAAQTLAAVVAWASWAGVLVGLLAPRPLGLTAARLVAPGFLGAAVAAAPAATAAETAAAVAVTLLAGGLAVLPETAAFLVNGAAYGDERRSPLRLPGVIALVVAPLAVALTLAGAVSGPLLLAHEQWLAGGLVTAVGLPVAAFLVRSLHS
ncbi:MAG TPA: hypothetical protein VM618_03890, partial [Acidimicrobiia bacterium]|nr:hypothetical protein [Acidimicrobiia bacterium]